MTDATVERVGMPLDEFLRRSSEENFELVNGEIVPLMPTVFGHTLLANRLLQAINSHAQPDNLGEAFVEMTFIKPDARDPNWVKGSRIPDVSFINTGQMTDYMAANPDWRDKPLALIPDLIVEIVSPTDLYSEVETKVQAYLRDGARLVWVFDLKTRSAKVYRQGSSAIMQLEENDMLDGEDVIPGFKIAVADLFGVGTL